MRYCLFKHQINQYPVISRRFIEDLTIQQRYILKGWQRMVYCSMRRLRMNSFRLYHAQNSCDCIRKSTIVSNKCILLQSMKTNCSMFGCVSSNISVERGYSVVLSKIKLLIQYSPTLCNRVLIIYLHSAYICIYILHIWFDVFTY